MEYKEKMHKWLIKMQKELGMKEVDFIKEDIEDIKERLRQIECPHPIKFREIKMVWLNCRFHEECTACGKVLRNMNYVQAKQVEIDILEKQLEAAKAKLEVEDD